jgi:hypothetical protein
VSSSQFGAKFYTQPVPRGSLVKACLSLQRVNPQGLDTSSGGVREGMKDRSLQSLVADAFSVKRQMPEPKGTI